MKAIFNILLSSFIILLIVFSCKKNEDGYANFSANPTSTIAGTSINFTDLSVNNPKVWHWDFGDGSISNVQNPTHIYNNGGKYTVALTVSYSYGKNTRQKTNYITIAISVPLITTSNITNITQTTATSGGNVTSNGGATVTARGVCWGTGQYPTIANSKTNDGTGTGSFTSSITGLSANTTYYVRAYATNSVGTTYGNQVSFTASTVNLPALTTTVVTNITQNTATGGGNITSDGGASVTARGVCWSTGQNPTIANNKTNDGIGIGGFTSSITGLTANTNYYVRSYATNSTGTAYGNQVNFITLTTPVLTTTTISNITQTTAIGGGTITSNGGSAVTARGVCWSTSQNPTIANSKTNDGTGSGSFTSSLTGLSANTNYYVRAYATNSAGTAYGNQLNFKTLSTTIPVLTTTAVTNITQTTATGGGYVTSDGGATVSARGICWSKSQNPTIANSKTNNGTGTGNFVSNITGLTANTTYYVRAYATNSAGTAYGNQVGFTTSAVNLPILTTTAVKNTTQTTANSGGNITSDGGATVASRGVCWNTGQNPTIANSKTIDGNGTGSFTSSITGLVANTIYYVRAYATNSAGTSYGNQVNFTTSSNCGSVSDFDGNVYNTVTIGTQCWMKQNLKTTSYNDGNAIPNVTNTTAWNKLTTGAWCDYNNLASNGVIYGHLYNWYAVNTGKLCPNGWHVPDTTEWSTLIIYLGGSNIAGGAMKSSGTTYWQSPNLGANNSSGFSALPGGCNIGGFSNLGSAAFFWSSQEYPVPYEVAGECSLYYEYTSVSLSYLGGDQPYGMSVRCAKN